MVDLSTRMVPSMKANIRQDNATVKESLLQVMDRLTKVNGGKASLRAKARRLRRMATTTRAASRRVDAMDEAILFDLMAPLTLALGKRVCHTVRVVRLTSMDQPTREPMRADARLVAASYSFLLALSTKAPLRMVHLITMVS